MPSRTAEIAAEQEVVSRLYRRLDALRQRAGSRLSEVRLAGPAGSPQNRSERDSFATLWEDRAAKLAAVEDRLAFGRLDMSTSGADAEPARYVGRIGLLDEQHRPLLTDWRAPAAEPFYRATARNPHGVVRRRHLVTRGRKVTGFEDDLLDVDADFSQSSLAGEGALLAALAERRTGQMRDIVATIQAEQDEIIRAPLSGALVVQGGPGTGKTAVALHRAAYLLYAHRKTLEHSGVLIVGPTPAFLRFIDSVLPSLGETGVVSKTIGELIPGISTSLADSDTVAELKGRAVWANIIRRAVQARERVPDTNIKFRLNGRELAIRPRDIRSAIRHARQTDKPHNEARSVFVHEALHHLVQQYEKVTGKLLDPEERAIILDDLRSSPIVRKTLNIAWFPISPGQLIDDLFAKPHRLAQAAPEFSPAELSALARPKGAPWTISDIPLLDEAAELLGVDGSVAKEEARRQAAERAAELEYARETLAAGVGGSMVPVSAQTLAERFAVGEAYQTAAERAAADRAWTYGHVVVDEAQELSPMAWRMLQRRVPSRSMTIVGDVAQTSSPGGVRDWATALDPVLHDSWRISNLTISYRTPAAVAQAAQRFAAAVGLPATPMTAARDVPDALQIVAATNDALPNVVADQVLKLVPEFVSSDGAGQVAVIAPTGLVSELSAVVSRALAQAHPAAGEQVSVLDPRNAKGLEFDAVVLVEPAEIAAQSDSDIYVAMTRPTQRLVVVHSAALPPGFQP